LPLIERFLTHRANDSAYATVFRPSVSLSSVSTVTLCVVAKRCVLEQKLPLIPIEVICEESTGTKMTSDLDLCLEVISGYVIGLHR